MTVELMRVKEIFLAALDVAEPAERTRYLRRTCGDDLALRQQVEALLLRHAEAGLFLEKPPFEALLAGEPLEALSAADSKCLPLRPEPPLSRTEEKARVESLVQRLRGARTTHDPAEAETRVMDASADTPSLGESPPADEIGPYRLQRLLGEGGMGLVFAAEDLQLRRPVALKVMRPDIQQRPEARARFLREARAAAAVRHEHVVTIHQVGEANDLPFLVMELLEGQSLETRCRKGPPFSLTEVVRIGREVAEGLAAAHATGLTHRDVKPDNIWLEAPRVKVKLLDFGLARAATGDMHLTQNGLIVGTPAYMAPEQARGDPVDARTDLFSLGCVLYRLAAGQLPFQGKTPVAILHALANDTPPPLRELVPEVPESLNRLVASLLARRPEDRPASAQAVAEALAAIEQEGTVESAEPTPGAAAPLQSAKRPPALVLLVAAGLCALALAIGAVTVLRLQTEQGEIVIQTSDPSVAVLFEQGKVQIHDKKSGKKYGLAVGPQKKPAGDYEFEVTDEAVGLTFSTRQFTLKRGEPVVVQVSFRPREKPGPAAVRPAPPVPADALQRKDIPDELLALAGGGDKAKAPPELVAVLGGARRFRLAGSYIHNLYTRFSPDGRFLVALEINDVLVFEASTGRLRHRLKHDRGCGWFDFRPDNKALVVNSEGGVDLWDLGTGKSLGRLTDREPMIYGTCFTPDAKSLVTTDADGKTRLWDLASKKVVRTFEPPAGHRFIQAPQIHRDGHFLALHASGPKPVVRVVDLETGDLKAELPGTGGVPGAPGLEYQTTVKFSPDGRLLASVRDSRAVQLWDVATWKEVGTLDGGASILSFTADSKTLFRGHVWSGGSAPSVLLDDVKTRTRKASLNLPVAGDDMVWSDLSPDGTTVAVRTTPANAVLLFDAATGKERLPEVGHRGAVTSVAVSPDGRLIASTANDHRLLLWGLPTGRVVRELSFVPQAYQHVNRAAFSADGKWVGAQLHMGDPPGWVRVWETATGKEVLTISTTDRDWERMDFAFHPRDNALITSEKGHLEKWLLPEGSSTTWEEGHAQPIVTVAFHPDGEQVAAGDKSGVVCLWDATRYKRLRQFRCEGPVLRARFSPDGQTLAATTAAPDAAVYWWDLPTGARTRRAGPGPSVQDLVWRPDNKMLATVVEDGRVLLWPHMPDRVPRTLQLGPGLHRQVAFTPDGRHLLAANDDGTIFVLRLAPAPAEGRGN